LIRGAQLFYQLNLRVGLLAYKKKDRDLPPGCNLAGNEKFCLCVFPEIEKLVFLVKAHLSAPVCPIIAAKTLSIARIIEMRANFPY
jgi:hypothetical protein